MDGKERRSDGRAWSLLLPRERAIVSSQSSWIDGQMAGCRDIERNESVLIVYVPIFYNARWVGLHFRRLIDRAQPDTITIDSDISFLRFFLVTRTCFEIDSQLHGSYTVCHTYTLINRRVFILIEPYHEYFVERKKLNFKRKRIHKANTRFAFSKGTVN